MGAQQAVCASAAGTKPAAEASHERQMPLWCGAWRTRKHSATCASARPRCIHGMRSARTHPMKR